MVAPHKFSGVFIARGKDDVLVTLNLVPGKAVYGEKRISVDVRFDIRLLMIEGHETNC